jgi:L-fuconolactonase
MDWEHQSKNASIMAAIDAHQHSWKYDPVNYGWINEDMSVIKKDFLPNDLQPVLEKTGFTGCVLVQSEQTKEHTDFLIHLASENVFIKGIVGWIDLRAEDIEEQLNFYKQHKKIKGFRHILQDEADRAMMLKTEFKRGIEALANSDYTYDILIHNDQLRHASSLVADFPYQLFVLDHIAKPNIREKKITDWEKGIRTLAEYDNVYCKLSGMVTENDWKEWKKDDFTPYIDIVVDAFGIEKLMFGSDWPVCLLAASYEETFGIVKDYFSSFSKDEQEMLFGGNAERFYNLN